MARLLFFPPFSPFLYFSLHYFFVPYMYEYVLLFLCMFLDFFRFLFSVFFGSIYRNNRCFPHRARAVSAIPVLIFF